MMQRRLSALIGAAALALAAGLPAASAAQAARPDRGFVIVDLSDGVSTSRGTFYPTGPLAPGTVVVIPNEDGTLPGGLSEAEVSQLVDQGGAALSAVEDQGLQAAPMAVALNGGHVYSAAFNIWSAPFYGNNIIGIDPATRVTYTFSVTAGTNQQAAGQGLGYYKGYNGGTFGVWAKWYGLGIASDGVNGGGTVPWGESIGTAQFKAKSTVVHVAVGEFTP